MHILVTRPEPFAKETSHFLRSQGHTVTEVPLLKIEYHSIPRTYEPTAQTHLVITSYQALQTPAIEQLRKLPLWGVGTQLRFKQLGWTCEHAYSNVQELKGHMPRAYQWLYIRGSHITQPLDMPSMYEHMGYTSRAITAWPMFMDWDTIDAVLLMSQATARAFLSLTSPSITQNLIAVCHSQAIMDVIKYWPWKDIKASGSILL